VRVGKFSYGVADSEEFDAARGESTAYSPKLVEVEMFSEVETLKQFMHSITH
jgi:hypothetical protein